MIRTGKPSCGRGEHAAHLPRPQGGGWRLAYSPRLPPPSFKCETNRPLRPSLVRPVPFLRLLHALVWRSVHLFSSRALNAIHRKTNGGPRNRGQRFGGSGFVLGCGCVLSCDFGRGFGFACGRGPPCRGPPLSWGSSVGPPCRGPPLVVLSATSAAGWAGWTGWAFWVYWGGWTGVVGWAGRRRGHGRAIDKEIWKQGLS